jgi:uncharacterized membrane protein
MKKLLSSLNSQKIRGIKMTLDTSKTLGGIGAILLLIGIIPFIQYIWIIGLVGVVLILAALHGLESFYNSKGIFSNAIYGIITGVVGVVIAVIVAVASLIANIGNINAFISTVYPDWNGDWSTLSGLSPTTANVNPSDLIPLISGLIITFVAVFVVVWVFAIISTFFFRRSLTQVKDKTNVGLFGTAGVLLFIGAILIIAVGFGFLLMWIAILLLAIAFFTIKIPTQQMSSAMPPPP